MVRLVVEENLPRLRTWLEGQWDQNGKQAAQLLQTLIEYAAPKLARAEAPAAENSAASSGADTLAALVAITFPDGGPGGDGDEPVQDAPRAAVPGDLGLEPEAPQALLAPVARIPVILPRIATRQTVLPTVRAVERAGESSEQVLEDVIQLDPGAALLPAAREVTPHESDQRSQMIAARMEWEDKCDRLTREFIARHQRLPTGRNISDELGPAPPMPGFLI